jgi:hypothetical protein
MGKSLGAKIQPTIFSHMAFFKIGGGGTQRLL